MNEITDKTFCIITSYGHKTYINKEQFDKLSKTFDNVESIILDDAIINKKYVVMIGPAEAVEVEKNERKGHWKCAYGYWHKRGEDCGHADELRYKNKINIKVNKSKWKKEA